VTFRAFFCFVLGFKNFWSFEEV